MSEPGASQLEETEEHMDIVETQSSQVLDKNVVENAEARHLEGGSINVSVPLGDRSGSMPLDLNTEVCTDENSGYNNAVVSLDDSRKHSSCAKAKGSVEHNYLHFNLVSLLTLIFFFFDFKFRPFSDFLALQV